VEQLGRNLERNKKFLNELIHKVLERRMRLRSRFKELADKYEYDALTRLLEDACRR